MEQAERRAERDSITKIEEYKKAEKHISREIAYKRNEIQEEGGMVAYEEYEEKLLGLVINLKGDLLDIEMALQASLESARNSFVNQIKSINELEVGVLALVFVNIPSGIGKFSDGIVFSLGFCFQESIFDCFHELTLILNITKLSPLLEISKCLNPSFIKELLAVWMWKTVFANKMSYSLIFRKAHLLLFNLIKLLLPILSYA